MNAKKTKLTTPLALTLDVDPDANRAIAGRVDCVSAGFNARITLAAARKGLHALHRLLLSLRLPATAFWEARTLNALAKTDPALITQLAENTALEHACHGLRHEDLTAHLSKCPMSRQEKIDRIVRATDIITGIMGTRPAGFRAPYCRVDRTDLDILSELGYSYDASGTFDAFQAFSKGSSESSPDAGLAKGIREIPMLLWRDAGGKPISGYLWQLLEGRRTPGEYIDMVEEIGEKHPGRLIQLALHPWHLAVKEDGQPVEDTARAADAVRMLLESLPRRARVCFTTIEGYLERRIR